MRPETDDKSVGAMAGKAGSALRSGPLPAAVPSFMRWFRVHFWLVLIYGTFATTGSYWLAQRIKFRGIQDWPSVDANIIASGSESYTVRTEYWDGSGTTSIDGSHVRFEYTVDGQRFESDLATPDGGGLPLYPTFTIVDESGQRDTAPRHWKAFYKPTSPRTAVLVPSPYEGTTWLYTALVCGLLIAIHLGCTLPEKLELLRWRRIARNRKAEQCVGGKTSIPPQVGD